MAASCQKRRKTFAPHSPEDVPLTTLINGRPQGCIMAEMLFEYLEQKHTNHGFDGYAARVRFALQSKEGRDGPWASIPRNLQELFKQTGFTDFYRGYWIDLIFCPKSPCGRVQSLTEGAGNACWASWTTCKHCKASLFHGDGSPRSYTSFVRPRALATVLANDRDIVESIVAAHGDVKDGLSSTSLDVDSWASAYSPRQQVQDGGKEATRRIVENKWCLKGSISVDGKEFNNSKSAHSIGGTKKINATMFKLKSVTPSCAKKCNKTICTKFIISLQMTAGWVNPQSQLEFIVKHFCPRKVHTVTSNFHDIFADGVAALSYWLMYDNSDGPAANQVSCRWQWNAKKGSQVFFAALACMVGRTMRYLVSYDRGVNFAYTSRDAFLRQCQQADEADSDGLKQKSGWTKGTTHATRQH